ncbi:hypothetical protein Fot_36345 [Forsythia ovata]|uniref:Uncharacterized protein n=1 Tax=Forsythia ovata TaxID=205694 RepID=A0ABD1SP58_9LAMI
MSKTFNLEEARLTLSVQLFKYAKRKIDEGFDTDEERVSDRFSNQNPSMLTQNNITGLPMRPLDKAGCKSRDSARVGRDLRERANRPTPKDRPLQYFSENLPHTRNRTCVVRGFLPTSSSSHDLEEDLYFVESENVFEDYMSKMSENALKRELKIAILEGVREVDSEIDDFEYA